MATSAELYRQLAELTDAMSTFENSVNNFIIKCSEAATKANSIKNACLQSNDTNIKNCGLSGGVTEKLAKNISDMKNNVSSAASTAMASARNEANQLRLAAIEAARREALAAQAKALAAKTQETSVIKPSTVVAKNKMDVM